MRVRSFYQGGIKSSRTSFLTPAQHESEGELVLLWPTPVYIVRNDLASAPWHNELREEILRRAGDDDFRADWKKSDFFKWECSSKSVFEVFLRKHIEARIGFDIKPRAIESVTWNWNAWVNVLPQQGWHQPHIHEKSTLSFIYYLEASSDIESASVLAGIDRGEVTSGILQFQDPRGAGPYMSCEHIDNVSSSYVRLIPSAGVLCIFPSFLSHFVAPNTTDGRRISVAGNVFGIKPKHGDLGPKGSTKRPSA